MRENVAILGDLTNDFDFTPGATAARRAARAPEDDAHRERALPASDADRGAERRSSATVRWRPPVSDGGSPIKGYTVTPRAAGAALAPQLFGAGATFATVTASRSVRATRSPSRRSMRKAPDRLRRRATPSPSGCPARRDWCTPPRDKQTIEVSWKKPDSDGGSPITGYVVTPYILGTAQAPVVVGPGTTRVVVRGLASGTAYTFTVTAVNANGNGAPSPPTQPVTTGPPYARLEQSGAELHSDAMTIDGYVATEFEPVLDVFARELRRTRRGRRGGVRVPRRAARRRPLGRPRRSDDRRTAGGRTRSSSSTPRRRASPPICANVLIERGLLDPEAAVATIWPEFGGNGKDAITVAQVMSHQAGLPYVEGDFTLEECTLVDADRRGARRAGADLGTGNEARLPHAHVRLARRRADPPRRSAAPQRRRVLARRDRRRRSASTSGSGCPKQLEPRVAQLVPPRTDLREALRAFGDELLLARVFSNPGGHFNYDQMWNTRQLHACELPSSNGIGTHARPRPPLRVVRRRGRRRRAP